MKQTRFTEAQIVDILAQAAKGEMTAVEVCRINGVSEQTFYRWKRRYGEMTTCRNRASVDRYALYRWKRRYGEMTTSDVRRLRELESENARLKRLLAERDLEIDTIRDVLRGK